VTATPPTTPRVMRVVGWSAMVPESALTLETTLDSLGIGSLERIECVLALEDEFQVELPAAIDLRRLRTVRDVVEVVDRSLTERAAAAPPPHPA
jgi:acyl carrier protein